MSDKKHQFRKNNTYFTISVYVVVTLCVSAILLKAIWEWASTIETIKQVITMLTPFLIGIFIAYLMNPLVNVLDRIVFKKVLKIKKDSRRFLGIAVAYIVVLTIVIMCISTIVPEIYQSLVGIYEGVQENYNKLITFLYKMGEKHPNIDLSYITNIAEKNSSNIIGFIQNSIGTVLPFLYDTSVTIISWTINIIIAIMVSVYMIIDKKRLLRNFKRLVYAMIKKERADSFKRLQ